MQASWRQAAIFTEIFTFLSTVLTSSLIYSDTIIIFLHCCVILFSKKIQKTKQNKKTFLFVLVAMMSRNTSSHTSAATEVRHDCDAFNFFLNFKNEREKSPYRFAVCVILKENY